MLQIEILSGGDVVEQLEVDGNKVYSESGKLPDFISTVVKQYAAEHLEARVKLFIDGVGNQVALKKGHGARLYKKGHGEFASHQTASPEAETVSESKTRRSRKGSEPETLESVEEPTETS